MVIGYEDVYDLILGSGALGYSWYQQVDVVMAPLGDAVWLVKLHMEDPDDSDATRVVSVTYSGIFGVCQKVVDDTEDSGYGVSAIHGVTEECRTQAALLLEDDEDCDFDAFTADEILQVLAYGEVIFS